MQANHPSKEEVRQYMAARIKSSAPPESPDRIREMLGWRLIEGERESQLQKVRG